MAKDGKVSGMFTARPPDKLLGNVGIKATQARLSKIKVLDATAPRYSAISAALKRWHRPICQALKRPIASIQRCTQK